MSAMKFLTKIGAKITEFAGIVTTAGAGDAGKLPALDANGKLDISLMPSGIAVNTTTAVVTGTLADRDMVYIKSDGTCAKADATAVGKEAVGFVKAAYTNGQTATIYLAGNFLDGLSALTPGVRYYLSTTAGALATETVAGAYTGGNIIQSIGIALSATALDFDPEDSTITTV